MKKFRVLIIMALSLMFFPFSGNAQDNDTLENTSVNRIEVIDFHSTNRCITCNAIEANTKYTLETYFSDELESGKITFLTINVDKDINQEMAECFGASGTSLFINVISNKKETHINLTNFAFMNGRKQKEFSEELKTKINTELKKL
jgi:hypothetical protein